MGRLRRLGIGLLAALFILSCSKKDSEVEFTGFSELNQGWEVSNFYIDVDPDAQVTSVEKLPEQDYEVTTSGDTLRTFQGLFGYSIKPDRRFGGTTPYDTDMRGHSPLKDGDDYWKSGENPREGIVSLKRKSR